MHTEHTAVRRSLPITQTILAILFEAGEGTLKSFFPHPYSHLFCKHKSKLSYRSAVKRLYDQGFIDRKASDDSIFYLTKHGEQEAFLSYINAEILKYNPKRQTWDGKWRIIFFDVPEKKRHKRDYLRSLIKPLGFKEFQKSIWISPYKIPDFLLRLLRDEQITPYVRFITTESIDYDLDLRKKFSLH